MSGEPGDEQDSLSFKEVSSLFFHLFTSQSPPPTILYTFVNHVTITSFVADTKANQQNHKYD